MNDALPLLVLVVKGAQGMTGLGSAGLDALAGFVGGLLSGVISGHLVARADVSYQRRAAAVTEIRRLALDLSHTFHVWTLQVGFGSDYYPKGFLEIAAKQGVLSSYYAVHAEWLKSSARASVERIIQEIGEHNSALMETASEDEEKTREAVTAAKHWHDQVLPGLIDDIRFGRSRIFAARQGDG
jgi:hypothetical protein